MPKTDLTRPSLRRLSSLGKGIAPAENEPAVDPVGGDFGAGVIRGIAVCTRGEALGHDMWCDAQFVQSVCDQINASGDTGVKARFTHPNECGDGLAEGLGRVKSARVDGDVVRGDLHLSKSSHITPNGNLAQFILTRAEEDPSSFGASIAYHFDDAAEVEFLVANTVANAAASMFVSPDSDNEENLPHCRLGILKAVDLVDSPAANPDGLFRADGPASDAERLALFALGLNADRPAVTSFGAHPDRVRSFVSKFLERNGLTLTTAAKEPAMPNESLTPATTQPAAADGRQAMLAELALFTDTFGAEQGTVWLKEGRTFQDCCLLSVGLLKAENAKLRTEQTEALAAKDGELKALNDRLASLHTGEKTPVTFSAAPAAPTKTLRELFAVPSAN
jgi:hypothetical protein